MGQKAKTSYWAVVGSKRLIGLRLFCSFKQLDHVFFFVCLFVWTNMCICGHDRTKYQKVNISIRSWDKRQKLATGLQWGQTGYQVSVFFCFKQLAHCLFVWTNMCICILDRTKSKKVNISIWSWDKRQKLATGLQWGQNSYQVSGFFVVLSSQLIGPFVLFCLFVCVDEQVHLYP